MINLLVCLGMAALTVLILIGMDNPNPPRVSKEQLRASLKKFSKSWRNKSGRL
jgi:hypothetical protein